MALDIKAAFEAAIAHQKAGRLGKAEAIYQRILELQPDHPDALHLLGLLRLGEGRPEEAVTLIGRAVDANDRVAPYHFNLAAAHAALEDYEAAAVHYEKALALSPGHLGARNNLAIALMELGRIEAGIAQLEAVIAAEPGHAEAHNNLGNALFQAGRRDEALECYREAIRLRPEFADAHDNIGKMLLERGRALDAIPHFEKAIALAPENAAYGKRLREARASLVPLWHFPMVNDTVRNEAYRRAIERAVDAGSVVLDIGAGTGLLAMVAARAGARRVTSCEMVAPIAEVAREIIARNGLADRINLVAKRSTELKIGTDMPEKATVIVHEIFDNGVLGEEVVPVLEHARANLATADARFVPHGASVYAMLVESVAIYEENRVREACGFDVTPFNALASPGFVSMRMPHFPYRPLSEVTGLFRFDLAAGAIRPAARQLAIPATDAGVCHAIAVWFRIELDDENFVDTGPDDEGPSGWLQAIQVLEAPAEMSVGDELLVEARHDGLQIAVEVTGLRRSAAEDLDVTRDRAR